MALSAVNMPDDDLTWHADHTYSATIDIDDAGHWKSGVVWDLHMVAARGHFWVDYRAQGGNPTRDTTHASDHGALDEHPLTDETSSDVPGHAPLPNNAVHSGTLCSDDNNDA